MLAQLVVRRVSRSSGILAACAAVTVAAGSVAIPAPVNAQGGWRSMAMHRPMRRGMAMMMSDPAARLLDQQTLLQLDGAQVNQLIAIHEATRKQQRALAAQMRALMPRSSGERTPPAPAQRDSLMSLMDAMRTMRWRATAAADSVLTPDQRREAARLATVRRSSMRGGNWNGLEGSRRGAGSGNREEGAMRRNSAPSP